MTTAREIARWRLRTQRLVAPHADSASSVVSGLLAVQAENPGQSAWAVACRTVACDAADLAGLLESGEVIRTHVLRPTWHYVAAADVGWLLELTAPRVRPTFLQQLTGVHGWSAGQLDRAVSLVVDALAVAPDQTRDELAGRLRDGGVAAAGQPLMLLLGYAELERLVCSGRPRGGVHTYASYPDRVPVHRQLERDEALAELAWRYVAGHGPATERDLAYWATLPVTDVRRGLQRASDRLASFELDGRTFWHAAEDAPPAGASRPAGHLLQILDETYRGYQETRMVLDADGLVPRGRETAIGMALVDGQLVARMKRTVARRLRFDLDPYRPLQPADTEALEQAAARYGAFLGLEAELVVA